VLVSNVMRNVTMHLATPWPRANEALNAAAGWVDGRLGITSDDPRNTWPGTRFQIGAVRAHEDYAPNGLHAVLAAQAMVLALGRRHRRWPNAYVICLVTGFLLFCLALRWQPWHSRLHLPLLVIATPITGLAFERLGPRVISVAAMTLATSSVYFLAYNELRPLVGPRSVLATSGEAQISGVVAGPYVEAARVMKSTGCSQVGLIIPSN